MKSLITFLTLLLLAGCGGGAGSASAPGQPATSSTTATAGQCGGSAEKSWVRAHLDDVYLWYAEIANVEPALYPDAAAYFDALLVRSKDRFSFTTSQASHDQFSDAGQEIGYGASYAVQGEKLRVTYVQPGSPAALVGLARGAEIVGMNGVPRLSLPSSVRAGYLYPETLGAVNRFEVRDLGANSTRNITLSATTVTLQPVQDVQLLSTPDGRRIGYLNFTDHIATAEAPLIDALRRFQQAAISDLVLDLRYNGGGYLYIAQELASMIGAAGLQNSVFERLQFNDRHPEKTADPANTLRFVNRSGSGLTLPRLGLARVFVLTSADTCSASESIINGLRPFIPVITLGSTSCGKPYGFVQKNNCGTAYFAIEFAGVNAQGRADYTDGFAPACELDDDFEHALGDPQERLLSAALGYASSGRCPAASASHARRAAQDNELHLLKRLRNGRLLQ